METRDTSNQGSPQVEWTLDFENHPQEAYETMVMLNIVLPDLPPDALSGDLAPQNWASYNVRKREKRLTKELKEDGKKEFFSRADHRQVAGSRTALQPG